MDSRSHHETCLSHKEHGYFVQDATLHYFGCLRDSERRVFYGGLPEKSKRRIDKEICRIDRLRSSFETRPNTEAGSIFTQFKDSIDEWRRRRPTTGPYAGRAWPLTQTSEESVDADVNAGMIYFKDSRPYSVPGVDNKFPNQKISVKDLLADDQESNPLMQTCDDNMIRYFHLPANNMTWVEEAMARYNREKRPDPTSSLRSQTEAPTKTQMLLRPEFWQGQQNGCRSAEVHARHMRPFFDVISVDPVSTERSPKNMALFMPYLHWETDRGRMKSADLVKEAGKIQYSMTELVDKVTANGRGNNMITVGRMKKIKIFNTGKPKDNSDEAQKIERRRIVGRTLLLAAALAEAFDSNIEQKLAHEYLHQQRPLHPRRTLDQSYYGALKNTQSRDRDQVVFRATSPVTHVCVKDSRSGACQPCKDNFQMVPRLIMVDQLWLWILDEKTVISCFPRRWGKINPDLSAVHKSIRMRLKTARRDEVHSAFDLALIIIDQCSRVFFDRTKANDRQPNLVESFADAIRDVTCKQTAAFDRFLIYTLLASREYRSKDRPGTESTQNNLLDINTEGSLLKEVKDILDELYIMTRIKHQQQKVAESFVKHIKHALRSKRKSSDYSQTLANGNDFLTSGTGESVQEKQIESARWTSARADDLLEGIRERIWELRTLEDAAKKTSNALHDLLALKQQQAGVVEAREAVKQATETLNQGRSIMLFTVVTIVFLPLSFCATIFGMNTAEFNGGFLTLHQQIIYMVPISFGIIFTSFLLAFGSSSFFSATATLLWSGISFPFKVATTWLMINSGLYMLSRDLAAKGTSLRDLERKKTGIMKSNARRENIRLKEMEELWKEDEAVQGGGKAIQDLEEGLGGSGSESFLCETEAMEMRPSV